jgi:hypothetical protein
MFFEDVLDDYAKVNSKASRRFNGQLKRLAYAPVERPLCGSPWNLAVGSDTAFDTECFRNYWLCAFKSLLTGEYFFIEHYGEGPLPQHKRDELHRALFWFKLIGFNSLPYDIPMIEAACKGATLYDLKELSDDIILRDQRKASWRSPYNHIDLIEVCPLEGSLKTYAARLHCKRLQEMPVDPHAELPLDDVFNVRDYCFNDLDSTELLYSEPTWGLRAAIELRERLGERYKIDIRSKSDAQVAEAVINAEIRQLTGRYPKRPEFDAEFNFMYEAPDWARFETPALQEALAIVQSVPFFLDGGGSPRMPEAIADLKVVVGRNAYKMGMGGLHSQEKSIGYKSDEDTLLIDRDVASYYPRIILNNRYAPDHLGEVYLQAYGGIVELRLSLKKQKNPDEAGLKIAINGTFGKQGNMYSTIYAPKLLIQTTMTGQLGLLLFIEMVEAIGVPVVSANTDGIVIKCPKAKYDELLAVVRMWEERTGFETEETRYKAIFSRDVNNYLAVKEKGDPNGKTFDERLGVKAKGAYSERGSALNSPLSKNPEALVCNDAVQAFLAHGTPVQDTIRACRDIRRFVVVRNVRGGAHKEGWYLGKVVRWYYAEGVHGIIQYVISGNKVSNSEGAKPCMELPDELPDDINYEMYIDRAMSILEDIGYFNRHRQGSLFI